jgi:PPPDE putative peptidase domain
MRLCVVFRILVHRFQVCRITEVPPDMVQEFLVDLSERFNASTYNLLSNNCNNFSDEVAQFLVGQGIPVRFHTTCGDWHLGDVIGNWMIIRMRAHTLQRHASTVNRSVM